MKKFRGLSIRGSVLLLGVLFLHGCASVQTGSDPLRARAEAYWKARVAGDLTAAFEFEELNGRKQQTLQQYARGNPPLFLRAGVKSARVLGPEKGVVNLDVEMRVPGLLSNKTLSYDWEDQWVVVEGRWYHKYKPALPGQE